MIKEMIMSESSAANNRVPLFKSKVNPAMISKAIAAAAVTVRVVPERGTSSVMLYAKASKIGIFDMPVIRKIPPSMSLNKVTIVISENTKFSSFNRYPLIEISGLCTLSLHQ